MAPLTRPIRVEDAARFVVLLDHLDNETTFLLFEPGERTTTAEQWQKRIEAMQQSGESTIFVAENAGELVGFLRVAGDTLKRVQHSALIVIAIRQAFIGQGIGSQLFAAMELWARQRHLHRLHLTVMTHNARAIALYKKMDFEIEGTLRHNIKVDGQYVDEYAMAKLLA